MKKMMQGAAALIALVGAGESMALEWMSNSVGFRYGQQFTNPNNPDKFAKRIYSFTHADGYRYGSNFFNLDVFLSDNRDPRKGTDHGGSEVYAVYRHQLYASRVFDRPLGTGLVKDYAFTLASTPAATTTWLRPRSAPWCSARPSSSTVPACST